MPKPSPAHADRERFFGIHIDLHARDIDTELGKHVTPKMVRRLIAAGRPDYIQYDCKGHIGFMAYPDSKVSRSAGGKNSKGIINDSLAIYRKETKKAGIPLLMHFSGVWDKVAGEDHPEWLALTAEGKPNSEGRMSLWGPYVTERMIPQMKEVIDRYDVDGFWIDGECWAMLPDHRKEAVAAFRKRTGLKKIPTKTGEPGWRAWGDVHRRQFFKYLKTYMDAIHAYKPGVQIASNWLYTSHIPVPVRMDVDFISGDFAPNAGVNSARSNARYMSSLGLPWDLMAWGFCWFPGKHGNIYKTAVALQQEAAAVLALGGGFQCYLHPDRHGGLSESMLKTVKEVADFCHARKDVCFQSEPEPQVCLLADSTSMLNGGREVGNCANTMGPLDGVLHAVLEAGHSADVVPDHRLLDDPDRWPVIVVPEWKHLKPALVRKLADYARRGGSLLVTGAKACESFRKYLGVTLKGKRTEQDPVVHDGHGNTMRAKGPWHTVTLKKSTKAIVWRTPGFMENIDRQPAATVAKLGKGKIAAFYGTFGPSHLGKHTAAGREIMRTMLGQLYYPVVKLVDAPPVIDLVVRRKDGKLVAHLNNLSGMATEHNASYGFTNYIAPTPPITMEIRLPKKPKRITLAPDDKALRSTWSKGTATVTVPPVHIHSAVVVE